MSGKQSRAVIRQLAGMLRSGFLDTITSSKNLLNCNVLQFSNGLKSNYYDQQGGVGLGIVVALDNTSSTCNVVCGGEILAKYKNSSQFSNSSIPIKVDSCSENTMEKINYNFDKSTKEQDIIYEEYEEEFTYVTCHGPNKSTTTRVYYGGCEYGNPLQSIKPKLSNQIGVFNISSPARFFDNHHLRSNSDFLSSCHLCRKGLQGKDIYMYRGEKAFCSEECRQGQMRIDDMKEQCRSEASISIQAPYSYTTSRDHIFSTGIVAV